MVIVYHHGIRIIVPNAKNIVEYKINMFAKLFKIHEEVLIFSTYFELVI